MTHSYHEGLPGFEEGMLLVDGCAECEERALRPLDAFLKLDSDRQLAAWRLMRAERWSGGDGADRRVSATEDMLLRHLYLVGVILQRAGIEPEEFERRLEAAHGASERARGLW